jgi:exonuclease III
MNNPYRLSEGLRAYKGTQRAAQPLEPHDSVAEHVEDQATDDSGTTSKDDANDNTTTRPPSNSSLTQRQRRTPMGRSNTTINFYYSNINGIKGKITSLKSTLEDTDADIGILCETHLRSGENLKIPGYTTILKNREGNKKGGGLALLVRNALAPNTSVTESEKEAEHMFLRINTQPPTFVGCFYGKQEHDTEEQAQNAMDSLQLNIDTLRRHGEVLTFGDFNAKTGPPDNATPSRNGQMLRNLCQLSDLQILNNSPKCQGTWTWHRHPNTKSAIDYVIATPQVADQLKSMIIDEEHIHKLVSKKKQSDHNAIILKLETAKPPRFPCPRKYAWQINEYTDWEEYQEVAQRLIQERDPTSYEEWAETILEAAHKSVGTRRVDRERRPHVSNTVKSARQRKRQAKATLNSTRKGSAQREPAKTEYFEAKAQLDEATTHEDTVKAERTLQKIASTGGVNSKAFWNIKRRAGRNGEDMNCLQTTNGTFIYEPEDVKEYVANYHECLFSNNSTQFRNPTHTRTIEQNVVNHTTDHTYDSVDPLGTAFTSAELAVVIKALPDGKAEGPNGICYELVVHGGDLVRSSLLDIYNNIRATELVPETWESSGIITLPKGNKKPHKLENKRSITLSDITCKIFERLMLNRLAHKIPFTEAQAGARKGRSTTDQVHILKSIMQSRTNKNLPTYLAFLDLHKAYDKVWRAAILENLWKGGIRGKSWRLIRKLNLNLKAKIATRFGPTRQIDIIEGIRQGGVLSGPEFAFLVDRLEKRLQEAGLGVLHGMEDMVASLLLMDDIVLVAESPEQLQVMLSVTSSFANEWHLTFSKDKSKVMIVNERRFGPHWWKLGHMSLEQTDTYTYLGEKLSQTLALTPHLKLLEQKMYTHTNRILATASSEVLSRIKMRTLLQLHDKCLIPALLYNCETWILGKNEQKKIDTLQFKALRSHLKTPKSTPKMALYAETGIYPLSSQVHQRQLMYLHKLITNDSRASKALTTETQEDHPKSWYTYIRRTLDRYNLNTSLESIADHTKGEWATKTKKAIRAVCDREIAAEAANSPKLAAIFSGKQAPSAESYMLDLTRKRASAIFRLRCNNTKAQYMGDTQNPIPICHMCDNAWASDLHLFKYCTATETLRAKHNISGLDELYALDPDLLILTRYADFALELGIVAQ